MLNKKRLRPLFFGIGLGFGIGYKKVLVVSTFFVWVAESRNLEKSRCRDIEISKYQANAKANAKAFIVPISVHYRANIGIGVPSQVFLLVKKWYKKVHDHIDRFDRLGDETVNMVKTVNTKNDVGL